MAKAILAIPENVQVIAEEAELAPSTVSDMLVAHPDTTYLFVIGLPYKEDTIGWAMVPDFTFDKYFEFVTPAQDGVFTEITKLSAADVSEG